MMDYNLLIMIVIYIFIVCSCSGSISEMANETHANRVNTKDKQIEMIMEILK